MEYASTVEYIYHHAVQTPETPAVIVGDTITTYQELWRLISGFAYYLKRERNVQKGNIVLTKASQTLDYIVLYFGTHLAGGGIYSVREHRFWRGV